MNPDDTQTVTEDQATADTPNEGKEAASEATGAQDTTETDWEALLEDSQTETEKPKPEPKAESGDEAPVSRAEFDALREDLSKKDVADALSDAVATIKGQSDDLGAVKDQMVHNYIIGLAEKRKGILSAFGDRQANPAKWNKAMKMIGDEIRSDLADLPDAKLTENVQAAAAAVRGVSTTLPAKEDHDNKHYAKMSDTQFSASIKEELETAGG